MALTHKEIARGAEAVLEEISWYGRKAVRKRRIPKGYRLPSLDQELRKTRTRVEARLLRDARKAGLPTPAILDVDIEEGEIIMEYLDGEIAKERINEHPEAAKALCKRVGELVARLHAHGMVHGDLTTSNIIVVDGEPTFIDMGLGGKASADEELGVDLHLMKQALESTHSHIPGLYDALLEGYGQSFSRAPDIVKKTREIEKRGRYT